MTSRHHHFLSQCYLRGFTKNGSKKSRLIALEPEKRSYFETNPRNVGGIRDFNRIEVEGVDQEVLEKSLSEFESDAATALRSVAEGADFAGENRETILTLLGLLAVRSPQMREHMRQFHEEIAQKVMSIALATKERWESQVEQMRVDGVDVSDKVTYEDLKRFHESKGYTVKVAREHHIRMEMEMLQTVVPILMQRGWTLFRSNAEIGAFVTCDRPVVLDYKDATKVPLFFRGSPGFGLENTYVYFPLAKNAALLGEFNAEPTTINANRELVANFNTRIAIASDKHIYAPSLDFPIAGRDGEVLSGKILL
ncbi:DUF4238 domain-containing protein [Pseudomonas aeruginosa]